MDIFEIHRGLPRESPGNDDVTLAILRSIRGLPPRPTILDIGCGPGAQTLVLARETQGFIIAVDTHQAYLDELMARASASGFAAAVRPMNVSMDALPFEPASFDLIWSEGAIYIMGFERGLREWQRYLRPAGSIVVSEATWLREDSPEEVRAFWSEAYPAMTTRAGNREIAGRCGLRVVTERALAPEDWFREYYTPLEARLDRLEAAYARDVEALAFLREQRREIEIVRRYGDCVGYVFYVLRRD